MHAGASTSWAPVCYVAKRLVLLCDKVIMGCLQFFMSKKKRRRCDLSGYMEVAMAVDDGAWGMGFFFFNAFMRASKLFLSVEDGS